MLAPRPHPQASGSSTRHPAARHSRRDMTRGRRVPPNSAAMALETDREGFKGVTQKQEVEAVKSSQEEAMTKWLILKCLTRRFCFACRGGIYHFNMKPNSSARRSASG
jgi:hypothetical protein